MPNCELIATCVFFNDIMPDMPDMAELMKDKYCRDDNNRCARYRVFKALGREEVPSDLFPIDMQRADQIMSETGNT